MRWWGEDDLHRWVHVDVRKQRGEVERENVEESGRQETLAEHLLPCVLQLCMILRKELSGRVCL